MFTIIIGGRYKAHKSESFGKNIFHPKITLFLLIIKANEIFLRKDCTFSLYKHLFLHGISEGCCFLRSFNTLVFGRHNRIIIIDVIANTACLLH
jgi:hypothetical protein